MQCHVVSVCLCSNTACLYLYEKRRKEMQKSWRESKKITTAEKCQSKETEKEKRTEVKSRWQTEKQTQRRLTAGGDDTNTENKNQQKKKRQSEHELICSVMLSFDRLSVNASPPDRHINSPQQTNRVQTGSSDVSSAGAVTVNTSTCQRWARSHDRLQVTTWHLSNISTAVCSELQ